VSGFSGRVRRGYYDRGHQVTCARVQVAVRVIGQTCEMDLGRNSLYRAPERYLKPLEIMSEGFTKMDPIPVPQVAVPVSVPEQVALWGLQKDATPKEAAIGDLALISFYYLLRVGGYTQKKRKVSTRTIQFRMCDIAFKCGNTIISRDAPEEVLMTATAATLRLSNQKNGVRGSLVHCSAMGGKFFPVIVLVCQYIHMRSNKAVADDILSSFWDHIGKAHVTDEGMRIGIRAAVITL